MGGLAVGVGPFRRPLAGVWADVGAAAGLGLLTLASRVPLWREHLFNWDAANFALAVLHFDVREHRPHPPGYFYYVSLGWLINLWLNDPNRSLILVSTMLSAGAVVTAYLLGRAVFRDRAAGLASALLLLTSVTFWAYGLVALAYPALPLFGGLVGLGAVRPWPLLATVALGVGSGFRPDLVLLLGPLWLWSLRGLSRRKRAGLVALLGFLGLCWVLPTSALSGGLSEYLQALRGYLDEDVWQRYAPGARGPAALAVNLRDTAAYVFYGLYFAAIPAAFGLLRLARAGVSRRLHPAVGLWFGLWVGPPLTFYTLVHIGDPGYVFSFLPAVTLVGGYGLRGLSSRRAFGAALLGVVLLNGVVFFFHPRVLTYPGLVAADRSLAERLSLLDRFPPDSTLVVAAESYRALQFYRPDYQKLVWVDRRRPGERPVAVPAGVRQVVVFDPGLSTPPGAEGLGRGELRVISARPGDVLVFRP